MCRLFWTVPVHYVPKSYELTDLNLEQNDNHFEDFFERL